MRMREKELQEIKRTRNSSFISLHLRGSLLGHILTCMLPLNNPQIYSKLKDYSLFTIKNNFIDYSLRASHLPKQSEN